MKKISVFSLIALLAAIMCVSCNNGTKVKSAVLENQNDSINYAFGLLNGVGLREEYMIPEKEEKDAVKALISEMDKSYAHEGSADMYELGKKVGLLFKMQEDKGLMGEADLEFNMNMAKLGVENELKGESAMSTEEAQNYIQTVMFQLQMKKMASQGGFNPYGGSDEPMIEDVIIDEQVVEAE